MKLLSIYRKKNRNYADFEIINGDIGIEYDKSSNKVLELHFSIVMQIQLILDKENYICDEEQSYFYDFNRGILTVPIKEK